MQRMKHSICFWQDILVLELHILSSSFRSWDRIWWKLVWSHCLLYSLLKERMCNQFDKMILLQQIKKELYIVIFSGILNLKFNTTFMHFFPLYMPTPDTPIRVKVNRRELDKIIVMPHLTCYCKTKKKIKTNTETRLSTCLNISFIETGTCERPSLLDSEGFLDGYK